MKANEYQKLAERTLSDHPDFQLSDEETMITWNAMGLAGESGEVADLVKKGIFHQRGLDREALIRELGDVLWYLSALCTNLDISMEEVMERNISKLRARYPDGFEPGRSTFKEGEAR